MITLAAATTAQTEAQVLAALFADMASEGVDAAGLSPFSVASVLPALDARALAHEQELRARLARAGFLDLAAKVGDEWVNAIVRAWFGIDLIPAAAARWLFRLTAAPAAGTITAGARELVADVGGVLFDNVGEVKVLAGSGALVEFQCRTRGIVGNVLPGATAGFQVGRAGLMITTAVGSGAELLFAGRDQERSADLVARGRARFAAKAIGGSRAAYLVWVVDAFTAAGLTCSITKIGVNDENPNGPGSTDVYLANAAGPATTAELALDNAYLQPRRALGTGPLRVLAAPALVVPIVATLHVDDNANAISDATAKLTALQAEFPLGGGPRGALYTDDIEGALLGPDGVAGLRKVDLTSPAEDVILTSPYQTIAFTYALTVAT